MHVKGTTEDVGTDAAPLADLIALPRLTPGTLPGWTVIGQRAAAPCWVVGAGDVLGVPRALTGAGTELRGGGAAQPDFVVSTALGALQCDAGDRLAFVDGDGGSGLWMVGAAPVFTRPCAPTRQRAEAASGDTGRCLVGCTALLTSGSEA